MEAARPFKLGAILAVLFSVDAVATDPSSISLGAIEVTPELTVDNRFDDNIYRSFTDEEDDFILLINPKVSAVAESGENSFSLDLGLVEGMYNDNDDDDFTDWTADADVHLEANSRNAFDVYAGYHFLHEELGTGFTQGEQVFLIDKPDTYEELIYGGAYTYGGESAKGRFKLAADMLEKEYDRFQPEETTRDYDDAGFTGTFYWKIGNKTDLLIEGSYHDIDYDEAPLDAASTLDSEETELLLGIEWQATGKTTGSIKLGLLDKDFDANDREDYEEEFSWDATVLYQPNDFHVFSVSAANLASEAVGTSDFINTDEYMATWEWELNDLTRLVSLARFATDEYEGSDREDDLILIDIGIERDIRRWFTVRLSYAYDERDSNDSQLDYERNVFLIGLDFSL